MSRRLLVDTGYFYALLNERDSHHREAVEKRACLELFSLVLPWPVLYETMNTRFSRRPEQINEFERIIRKPDVEFVDDSPYRSAALESAFLRENNHERKSLVDFIICAMIEDDNVKTDAILTFNHRDFRSFCMKKGVGYLCDALETAGGVRAAHERSPLARRRGGG